ISTRSSAPPPSSWNRRPPPTTWNLRSPTGSPGRHAPVAGGVPAAGSARVGSGGGQLNVLLGSCPRSGLWQREQEVSTRSTARQRDGSARTKPVGHLVAN